MKRFLLVLVALSSLLPFVIPQTAFAACGVKEKVKEYYSSDIVAKCVDEQETCQGNTIQYSCCVCETERKGNAVNAAGENIGIITVFAENGYTHDACVDACNRISVGADKYHPYSHVGAGALPAGTAGPKTLGEVQAVSKYCFTQSVCASSDYGGSIDQFRPGYGCPAGKGRCVAAEPNLTLSNPIGGVTTVAGFRGFLGVMFNYTIGIAAIAAAVMFVWGGMRYIFGSAFQSIQRAKEIMVDAAIGLLLVLGAMAILRTVNPATLDLTKLEVFLVNREEVQGQKFCREIIPSSGKLAFADAGKFPQYTAISQLKDEDYNITQEKTQCNYEYYLKGFGENRCKGETCPQKDQVCAPCPADGCRTTSAKDRYECRSATIGGKIVQDGNRPAQLMTVLAVCNGVVTEGIGSRFLDAFTGAEEPNLPAQFYYVTPIEDVRFANDNKTQQGYSVLLDDSDFTEASEFCGDHGVLGYLLGVNYKDTSLISVSEHYTVIGPKDCDGKQSDTGGVFMGYADLNDIQTFGGQVISYGAQLAAMCAGVAFRESSRDANGVHPSKAESVFADHMWKEKDFRDATSKGEVLTCNLSFTTKKAPGNLDTLPFKKLTGYDAGIGGDITCY